MKFNVVHWVAVISLLSSLPCVAETVNTKTPCIFVSVGTNDAFWASIIRGSEDAAQQLGYQMFQRSAAGLEGEDLLLKQEAILTWSDDSLHCKGVLLAPMDFRISKKVEALKAKGVFTVYVDRDDGASASIGSITTNNKAAGAYAAELMHKKVGADKRVVMFREVEGVKTTNDRAAGFLERATMLGLTVIDVGYVGEVYGEIRESSIKSLNDNAGVAGVFTPNELITWAVSRSLGDTGQKDVVHIGFDINKEIVERIRSGRVYGVLLQDPYRMGFEGVYMLDAAIKGETSEYQGSVYSDVYFVKNENLTTANSVKKINNYGVRIDE